MIDSLFDKKTAKKFDDLAAKQAKIDDKKQSLADEFMDKTDSETIKHVLEIVKTHGHPSEKNLSEKIEKKYFSGKTLEFNDLLALDKLYKSNLGNFSKGDEPDE